MFWNGNKHVNLLSKKKNVNLKSLKRIPLVPYTNLNLKQSTIKFRILVKYKSYHIQFDTTNNDFFWKILGCVW